MKYTLNQYIAKDLVEGIVSSIHEENILAILTALKKKVSELLNEELFDDKKVDHYLKIVAMFEQLFRYITSKKIDPNDIVGFKNLVNKNDMSSANENAVEAGIEKILKAYDDHSMINFKRIVEKRFAEFKTWFFGKNKEDLEIVSGAIDFTLKSIESFQQSSHVA